MEQNFESGTNILGDFDKTQQRRKYIPCIQRIYNLVFKKEQDLDR